MDNKALGKGLSALIPEKKVQVVSPDAVQTEEVKASVQNGQVKYLKVNLIDDSRLQPRQDYDLHKLEQLKGSIKEKGVLQPLLVRSYNDRYEVVAGERRLRAVRLLGLDEVPCIVKNLSDQECLVVALIENVQREDLNPVEEALAYQRLIKDFEYTQEQIAKSLSKDRSTISNLLRLLKLPEYIQFSLSKGDISIGHARALLAIDDEEVKGLYFQRVLEKSLSVRELERLIQAYKNRDKAKSPVLQNEPHAEILNLEEELQKLYGTKVKISRSAKRGKIVVEYYSLDDLNRILKVMKSNDATGVNSD